MRVATRLPPPTIGVLARGLEACERLLERHLAAAVARFGHGALGVIDLPTLTEGPQAVPDQVRAAAALYWTSEVDEAGLLAFADALAEGAATGRLGLALSGASADRVMQFWRDRDERFTADERRGLYETSFGRRGDEHHPFRSTMRRLCEVLRDIGMAGRDESTYHLEVRAAMLGRELGEWLSTRGTGITAYAARDIAAHARDALALLRDPALMRAMGGFGTDLMALMTLQGPRLLGRPVSPGPAFDRAGAGLAVLTWVGESVRAFERGRCEIPRRSAITADGQRWLEAEDAP